LATVIAIGLRSSGSRLGIVEHGTGGALVSLFARDPDAAAAVPAAKILPVDLSLDATLATDLALDLATEAGAVEGANIGVSMVFTGTRQDLGLVSGTVLMAIARDGQPPRSLTSLPVRSTLVEVQRRAGLHAADMLRQELRPDS
jgi:nicotinamide mononucleotide (NMN) deamidase PncC